MAGRLVVQFILMPAWFIRGISSGFDWLVWQEERPSTVAVRDKNRMERIMDFMVLLGCGLAFSALCEKNVGNRMFMFRTKSPDWGAYPCPGRR